MLTMPCPNHHCQVTKGQLVVMKRELRKVLRLSGRTVLDHQAALKQQRLVTRESLMTCQSKARANIPELLGKLGHLLFPIQNHVIIRISLSVRLHECHRING